MINLTQVKIIRSGDILGVTYHVGEQPWFEPKVAKQICDQGYGTLNLKHQIMVTADSLKAEHDLLKKENDALKAMLSKKVDQKEEQKDQPAVPKKVTKSGKRGK